MAPNNVKILQNKKLFNQRQTSSLTGQRQHTQNSTRLQECQDHRRLWHDNEYPSFMSHIPSAIFSSFSETGRSKGSKIEQRPTTKIPNFLNYNKAQLKLELNSSSGMGERTALCNLHRPWAGRGLYNPLESLARNLPTGSSLSRALSPRAAEQKQISLRGCPHCQLALWKTLF